jgi:heme o synthase
MRRDADAFVVTASRFRPAARLRSAGGVAVQHRPTVAADLRELLKPGISLFVVATAAAGYLFGAPAGIEMTPLLALLVGTGLTAGGSGALNHLIEAAPDSKMRRTSARPLPAGRLSRRFVLLYGTGVIALGLALLLAFTNPLTALLALATAFAYVAIYTPLKRRTVMNTFVGAVPGALPALGGFAAATGTLGPGGWAAFAILFLWQLPHFFALAWMYRDDYARGGFMMLPVTHPDGVVTARVALAAALMLLIAGVLPAAMGLAGWLYLGGMIVLGTWFTIPAFAFASEPTDMRARRLLVASIIYVPVFFGLVVLDYVIC